MNQTSKYLSLLLVLILSSLAGFSQLASERPVSYKKPDQVQPVTVRTAPAAKGQLASEKKMPEVSTPAKVKAQRRRTSVPPDSRKLPSNSKTKIKDLVKKPKVKN